MGKSTEKKTEDNAQEKRIAELVAQRAAEKQLEELEAAEAAKQLNIVVHDDFTATATLPLGIYYEEELHKTVNMRLFMVADNLSINDENGYQRVFKMYTHTILSLGKIPKEKLTLDFYKENLPAKDLDSLIDVHEAIKKKRESTTGV